MLLLVLATIAALPQLVGLLEGIHFVQTKSWHTRSAAMMRTAEALPWLLHVLTNGILRLPGIRLFIAPNIVALVLLTLALAIGWWRLRQREWFRQLHFLPFATLAVLLMVLFVNEILLLVRVDRLRYFMVLWPLTALMIDWVVWRTRGQWRLLIGSLIIAFVIYGFWANTASEMRYVFYNRLYSYPLQPYLNKTEAYAGQADLLVIGASIYYNVTKSYKVDLRFRSLPEKILVWRDSPESREKMSQAIHEHLRLWLLAGEVDGAEHRTMIAQLPPDMEPCQRFIHRRNLVLELYAWSAVHCQMDEPAQLHFGEEIELVASEVTVMPADMLRVDLLMHTDSSTGMTAYSVALHVFDAASGEKVAQGDQGLWLGRYNPLRSEMDISGLLAGDYELRVAVYNWQTLERLAGVDLASGATGNLLTLFRFRVE